MRIPIVSERCSPASRLRTGFYSLCYPGRYLFRTGSLHVRASRTISFRSGCVRSCIARAISFGSGCIRSCIARAVFLGAILLFCIGSFQNLRAQGSFHQDFEGDSALPATVWKGTDTAWVVTDHQLQSHWGQLKSSFYLSTANKLQADSWEWWIKLAFNPSSQNYVDVFLLADTINLLSPVVGGYFVRVGNTADEVSLYHVSAGKTPVKLIDGVDGVLDKATNTLKVKVTRHAGQWQMQTAIGVGAVAYGAALVAPDSSAGSGGYFGFAVKQSTASFVGKHFFDDITVGAFIDTGVTTPPVTPPDTVVTTPPVTPPDTVVTTPPVTPPDTVVTTPPVTPPDTVVTTPPVTPPDTVVTTPPVTPPDTVVTTPPVTPPDTVVTTPPVTPPVHYGRAPALYELVITEFLPDPTPAVGLPAYRFVELKNISPDTLQLEGCTLGNRIRKSIFPNYLLPPGALLITCDQSAVAGYKAFGQTLGLKAFPAFKTADTIVLENAAHGLLHVVAYDKTTYKNDDAAKGGRSLEMIAFDKPCTGPENWTMSTALKGGTPGTQNTISGSIKTGLPDLQSVFPTDSIHLHLSFATTLDSLAATTLQHYQFKDAALNADSAKVIGPLWNQVILTLHQPLQPGTLYTLITHDLTDCNGQQSGVKNEGAFALTVAPQKLDVVFNEVMYDPLPNMPQFIELYNRSNNAVDLSHLYLILKDKNGKVKSTLPLSAKAALLLGSSYAVISEDPVALCNQSLCGTESPLLAVHLPQLSNEGAGFELLYDETELDAFAYSPDMQFGLLGSAKGISLERIDVNAPTQVAENWHSAAATANYSTPGLKNSQASGGDGMAKGWQVTPSTFSPDHDGMDDLAFIDYKVSRPGFMANITVFDSNGRAVRDLVHNSLLGVLGRFAWDGRDDNMNQLPAGIYIIYASVYDQQGTVQHWKQPLVLARRLK